MNLEPGADENLATELSSRRGRMGFLLKSIVLLLLVFALGFFAHGFYGREIFLEN